MLSVAPMVKFFRFQIESVYRALKYRVKQMYLIFRYLANAVAIL